MSQDDKPAEHLTDGRHPAASQAPNDSDGSWFQHNNLCTSDSPASSGGGSDPSSAVLVLRAGEQIWQFSEPEGLIKPGEPRPILIVDEKTIHLAHTDRKLEAQELLQRLQKIIDSYEVPVQIELKEMRWLNDPNETRMRILACLRDHPKKSSKMIMGLDYMGKWATFNVLLGIEYDPFPVPPAPARLPAECKFLLAGALISFFVSVQFNIVTPFAWMGLGLLALALYRVFSVYQNAKRKAYLQMKKAGQKVREEIKEKYFRTFKVDDLRLFTSAMDTVFEVVVNDIVAKGGEVVRVEGGQGGFFQGSGSESAHPITRISDASNAEV